jgi:peroxiredoxin family protein
MSVSIANFDEVTSEFAAIKTKISEIESEAPNDRLAIVLFSGDLDKMIAAFIIATGAAASDMQVDIFVTFWGLSVLRDATKKAKKSFIGKMFDFMLPRGSKKLKLSQMQMGGMGSAMIRGLMEKQGTLSPEKLLETAGELGVNIHVCNMSMDLMQIKDSEFIDYPHLNFCGVASFISFASDSKFTLFI